MGEPAPRSLLVCYLLGEKWLNFTVFIVPKCIWVLKKVNATRLIRKGRKHIFKNTACPGREGNCTASLGSLLQCLTTLSMKKLYLISNVNVPWCNLKMFPHFLSPAARTGPTGCSTDTFSCGVWSAKSSLASCSSVFCEVPWASAIWCRAFLSLGHAMLAQWLYLSE